MVLRIGCSLVVLLGCSSGMIDAYRIKRSRARTRTAKAKAALQSGDMMAADMTSNKSALQFAVASDFDLYPKCVSLPEGDGATVWAMCGCTKVQRWGGCPHWGKSCNDWRKQNEGYCDHAAQQAKQWGPCVGQFTRPTCSILPEGDGATVYAMCGNMRYYRHGSCHGQPCTDWLANVLDQCKYEVAAGHRDPVRGPKYIKKVTGYWRPYATVTGQLSLKVTHGTSRAEGFTRTQEWSSSVSSTVTAGLTVKAGFLGSGSEFNFEVSLSASQSRSMSNAHSQEWTRSQEVEVTRTWFGQDGHQIWQWIFDIDQANGQKVETRSNSFAQTHGLYEEPKCLPSYALPSSFYQTCHSDGQIPSP